MRERYGMHTFGQSLLMARRLIEAGTKFVQVNWPSVANGDPETDGLGYARGELRTAEESALSETRSRSLSALLEDMDQRGLLKETLVVAIGEFGRQPAHGRVALRATATRRTAAITGRIATAGLLRARALRGACNTASRMRPRQPEGKAGPPERSAGHGVLRARHRPRHGDPQSPESTARTRQGQSSYGLVRVSRDAIAATQLTIGCILHVFRVLRRLDDRLPFGRSYT